MSVMFILTHVLDFLLRADNGTNTSLSGMISEEKDEVERRIMRGKVESKLEYLGLVANAVKNNVIDRREVKADSMDLVSYKAIETLSMIVIGLQKKTVELIKECDFTGREERLAEVKEEMKKILEML